MTDDEQVTFAAIQSLSLWPLVCGQLPEVFPVPRDPLHATKRRVFLIHFNTWS